MNAPAEDPRPPEHVLVTGYPSLLVRRLVEKLLQGDPEAHVLLLAREALAGPATDFASGLPGGAGARVRVLVGDVADMDLGLSGSEIHEITDTVTTILHGAGVYTAGSDRGLATNVNLEGTRTLLDVAVDCRRLRRVCHFSTAFVSGRRQGVILEEELDLGQRFFSAWEQSKLDAEKLVASAARRIPVTIFRPSAIVGDSATGAIDQLEGPTRLIAELVAAGDVPLPASDPGSAPLHLVPVDYVVDVALQLAQDTRAAGGTFHLVDPAPLPLRTVLALVGERAGRRGANSLPAGLSRVVHAAPGLGRLLGLPEPITQALGHHVFYNTRRTQALLDGTGLRCPPLESYLHRLVDFARRSREDERRRREDQAADPLE